MTQIFKGDLRLHFSSYFLILSTNWVLIMLGNILPEIFWWIIFFPSFVSRHFSLGNWIWDPIFIFEVFLFKLWIQIIIVINFLDWKKINKNTQKNKDLFSLISLIKNLRSLKINNARQTIFSCQNCAKWKKKSEKRWYQLYFLR